MEKREYITKNNFSFSGNAYFAKLIIKCTLFLFVLFYSELLLSQNKMEMSDSVIFIEVLHIENATKDGIYLGDYVVNIPYEKAKELDGKKIKVSGTVTVVKGLNNNSNTKLNSQGRSADVKHILTPKIEVLEE